MKSTLLLNEKPYLNYKQDNEKAPWQEAGMWPTQWVGCRNTGDEPFVAAYRKFFTLDKKCTIRVHVSADERYELFLDGGLIGRGSERGDKNNWYFETYDMDLKAGDHIITARTWSFKHHRPSAQMSVHPGFIFSPEEEEYIQLLGTGVAQWEAKVLDGYTFIPGSKYQWVATGAKLHINGHQFPWGFEKGEGEGWQPVIPCASGYWGPYNYILDDVHVMTPAVLPSQMEEYKPVGAARFVENLESLDEAENNYIDLSADIISEHEKWDSLLRGNSITIEPNSMKRVIVDLGDYYCMYPRLDASGGKDSFIRLSWAEALYEKDDSGRFIKGNRDVIENRFFRGIGDEFIPDGGDNRCFDTLWWHSGRYLEITIQTQDEALKLDSLKLYETRYPVDMESAFECKDANFEKIRDICFRTLQMCAHETYMDCPYYEQLMYVGDTRLQALITYTSALDSSLPRKAVQTFANSALNHTGLIKCAYPETGGKIIPSFCLWWIGMVYDYALWRGEKDFIRGLMRITRGIVDRYIMDRSPEGLLYNSEGWNFYDWANDGENRLYNDNMHWSFGVPGHSSSNINSIFNWHMVLTLKYLKALEEYVGEKELAQRADRLANELAENIVRHFWDADKKMFSDDLNHQMYSEHSQCLAVLSGTLDEHYIDSLKKVIVSPDNLIGASIYFSHYSLETLYELNCEDAFKNRLTVWNRLLVDGMTTTPEVFSEETRSDCHAWGAHPLYHMHATILGIRPSSMGFETVQIKPFLSGFSHIKGSVVHMKGNIKVEYTLDEGCLSAVITLPDELYGSFIYKGKAFELKPGKQEYKIKLN